MGARAEMARLVLQMLKDGHSVPTHDALQLRNWAVRPKMLRSHWKEIGRRILSWEENSKAKTPEQG
jgi:hypothetical protein